MTEQPYSPRKRQKFVAALDSKSKDEKLEYILEKEIDRLFAKAKNDRALGQDELDTLKVLLAEQRAARKDEEAGRKKSPAEAMDKQELLKVALAGFSELEVMRALGRK